MKREIRNSVLRTIAEAFVWSTLWAALVTGLVFCSPYTPPGCCAGPSEAAWWPNLFTCDFAARWDGSCAGWDRTTNLAHLIGNVLIYASYMLVGFAMLRLHPPAPGVKWSRPALRLAVGIFWTCGTDHLLQALMHFRPMYRAFGAYKFIEGSVAFAGSIAIAFALATIFAQLRKSREEFERRRAKAAP